MSAIRLMFAMRSEFFRESFARLLQGDAGLQVDHRGGCTFADEVEASIKKLRPDILLMDIKLYRGDSIKVMISLLQLRTRWRKLSVSVKVSSRYLGYPARGGAMGYLLRILHIKVMKRVILNCINGKRI